MVKMEVSLGGRPSWNGVGALAAALATQGYRVFVQLTLPFIGHEVVFYLLPPSGPVAQPLVVDTDDDLPF